MSIPAVLGYIPLSVTPRSQVCDEQGVGQWPMWKRFDSVKAIVDQYVDEPYREFLAMPYHEVDKMKNEELFYWYTPSREGKYICLSMVGDDHEHYKQLLDETIDHYRSVVESLKRDGKFEEARFLELSLKNAGVLEGSVYCGNNRVVATVWGMRPRPGYDIKPSILETDLFPPTELHTVRFDIGINGTTNNPTTLKKSHGSKIFANQIPIVRANDGYEFIGWDREPLNADVSDDLSFVARYKQVLDEVTPSEPEIPHQMHQVRFLKPDGELIRQIKVEHGTKILPGLVPQLPVVGDAICSAWDGDPLNDTINDNRDYTAIGPSTVENTLHQVRFLKPDGELIRQIEIEHGTKILPGLVPQLPVVGDAICSAWDGDPLNDTINDNRDYTAIGPSTVENTLHQVRFLTPEGNVISLFQVEHNTRLVQAQFPPLPNVDGVKCSGWNRDPLSEIISEDKDFTAILPKKKRKGLLAALLKWLLLLLGLLLLFFLLWFFFSGKCHFNLCGCDCYSNNPSAIVRPEPVIDNEDDVPTPTENCGVHFSGHVLSDEVSTDGITIIFENDPQGEYVGRGYYPDNSKTFPKAVKHTFDAIAVDKGTRLIMYREPNFEGDILLDVIGPVLITNVRWINDSRYNRVADKEFSEELQSVFPPSNRQWSSENMHDWSNGSCKIMCQQCGD